MSFHPFLEDLFDHGRVIVASQWETLEPEPELLRLLAQYETRIRPTLPPSPPEFYPEVAFWAATRLYRACQFAVLQEISEETLWKELLLDICPLTRSPVVDYSVDLTFRFLPSLNQLVLKRHSPDPLLEALRQLGREWPLSSVGMADLGQNLLTEPFHHHEGLRRVYMDRIIAYKDWNRLEEDWIKPPWKQWIGALPPQGYPVAVAG